MSEVASRASAGRGRGSGRGGRGGFTGRSSRRANGDKADQKLDDSTANAFENDGEFAELRKQYGSKTSVIREMFPDWSEADVLFALQETNGDENEAVTRIAEGTISQWGEVSKTKKTPKPKTKDATSATAESSTTSARTGRGGRAVSDGTRGRAKTSERGGGRAARGRSSQAPTNGSRNKENQQISVPTEESSAWGEATAKPDPTNTSQQAVPSTQTDAATSGAPQAKTWASMVRQSTVPKPTPRHKEAPVATSAEAVEPLPPAPAESAPVEPTEENTPVAAPSAPAQGPMIVEPEVALSPPKDELTETNLEQVVDESKPPATGTAASTTADSWDPRQNPASTTATPISAAHQQHQTARAGATGYATAALKATADRNARVPSYQRRVLDQEEAVRMPGNREVDRAAVQFGAFSLNGGDEDVDGDREEPETRAQPPAESPVAHPRASLPPVAQPAAVPEAFPQKPGANVPHAGPPGTAGQPGAAINASHPAGANAQQYGRFGQSGAQDAPGAPQKPNDPFSQTPGTSQPPFDSFPSQSSQQQSHPLGGAYSSAAGDYSSYYTANQPERGQFNYYNQQYGQQQQGSQGPQDAHASQQRPLGGFNSSQGDNLSQYPQSGPVHNQQRLGGGNDSQNSGHNTPNPTAQAQQHHGGAATLQQQQQSHGQQYPAYGNHPYYNNPYYSQYYGGYGQGNFGPYGKGGSMYGQPYGMSPNAPYDHGSSPASFGQSSLQRGDSGLGSGLGDYGRGGSGHGANQAGIGGSGFGNVHDSFARGGSSFQNQGQSFNSQNPAGAAASSTDDLKPFSDSKPGSGPSPSMGGARPGSATNTTPNTQGGLPPPQGSQMGGGYGGYPSHLQGHGLHGSNAYGGGNQHGNSPYGSYNQGFGSGGYYGAGQQQQQQHQQQQRGGWGGNYH